jgi:hypothetical protein
MQRTVVKVNYSPDNLRWDQDGKILVAGQNIQTNAAGNVTGFKGWTVAKLDPESMKVTEILRDGGESPMQNVSVAIDVEGTLWMGPFSGNRLASKPLK